MSLLNTGLTALSAAQLGLATTQHNIANANTPGYSRQAIMQSTNYAVFSGAGYIGQGVHVDTILRSYSDVLTRQVNEAQSKSSELDAYNTLITRIDSLLAESSSGVSPVLAGFFQGVQDVAANPGLTSARQSMVSNAQALVTRFQILDDRLTQLDSETNTQIRDSVALINAYSQQIASLNEKIVGVLGTGQPPNDLLDERDRMVLELNKLVRVTAVQDSDGALNIFAGLGQQLVVGNQPVALEARPSLADPGRIVIAQKDGKEIPVSYFDGGSIGGLLKFRAEALDPAMNTLGQLAASIALTVNAQQQLGQDLLDNIHDDTDFVDQIFKTSAPKGIPNANNSRTAPGGAFRGEIDDFHFLPPEMSSDGNFYTSLTGSDYEAKFNGASFTITRLSDNKVVATGLPDTDIEFDGLSIKFSTGHAAGDRYLLQPTREISRNIEVNQDVVADVRKIAAASPIRTGTAPTNVGDAIISPGEVIDPAYTVPNLTLHFNNGQLDTVPSGGLPGGAPIPYVSGQKITLNGFEFAISGTPANGDQFTLSANSGGLSDSRNIVRIGNLQTQMTMGGADATKGTATFQISYAELVSDIGTKTRTGQINADSQAIVLEQAVAARESAAGVNLDEEYANIMQYQLSYQAAARMMDTVSQLFDVILSLGR